MIFVKNSRGGREVNMINTLSKIHLSKIGWEGGGSTSIWMMSANILCFFYDTPKVILAVVVKRKSLQASEPEHRHADIGGLHQQMVVRQVC